MKGGKHDYAQLQAAFTQNDILGCSLTTYECPPRQFIITTSAETQRKVGDPHMEEKMRNERKASLLA